MAKFFNSDRFRSFRKIKKEKSSSSTENPAEPGKGTKGKVLPIDRGKRARRPAWPMSTSDTSLNAGAAFLLVIGVLCGLYLSGSDKKSPLSSRRPNAAPQMDAVAQTNSAPETNSASETAAVPVQHLAKPSPIVPAERVGQGVVTVRTGAPSAPRAAQPHYVPTRFEATHKKMFGGCTGQLELTASRLRFSCRQDDLDVPVDAIAKTNKNGIVLRSGEKYHFTMANRSKDQVEAIFIAWLNRVQSAPPERAAAF